MKRFPAFTFCLLLLAAPVLAQEVQVRSGQHSGFTRLIVDLPERVEMQLEQGSESATVNFPNQEFVFDISQVFKRIARERIIDVVPNEENSSLEIKLGCRCEISSFWHGQSLLVLDFREGEEKSAEQKPTSDLKLRTDTSTERTRLNVPKNNSSFAASLTSSHFSVNLDQYPSITEENDTSSDTEDSLQSKETIARAHQGLIKQIGRAASQGLLEPRTNISPAAAKPNHTEDDAAQGPDVTLQAKPKAQLNLKAQSSIDRDLVAAIARNSSGGFESKCLDHNTLDVGSWAADTSFTKQVGHLRTQLIGEFDSLNQDAVIELTQLYLHYGFGVEAIQTLDLIDSGSEKSAILRSVAEIMSEGHASTNSVLSGQIHCDGPPALWSLLSFAELPRDTPINLDAALRTFNTLPSHLRNYLGPTFSRRLLENGYEEAASKVLSILDRSEETQSSGAQLVSAEVNISNGKHASATAVMEEIVKTNTEPSAEALIKLLDATIEAGQIVSYENAILAGAYAQQNRGASLSNELVRVYLTGLSASGAFEQAYVEFERLSKELPADFVFVISSQMLDLLTKYSDDYTFVKHALGSHSDNPSMLMTTSANAAANRLLELGFANQASVFVKDAASGKEKRDRRILRAKISLRKGQPRKAEEELSKLEGMEPDLLRAQARNNVGDHAGAAAFYDAAGEEEKSMRQAWLAEDWHRLKNTEQLALADIAALAILGNNKQGRLNDLEPNSRDQRVLAQNLELIQQSLAARDAVEAVLSEHPSP